MNQNTLVIFDFDGTITTKDTMLDLVKWHFGFTKFCLGMLRIFPKLFLYKIGFIPNDKAKEIFLNHFFGGMDYKNFCDLSEKYSLQIVDSILHPQALEKIKFYKSKNCKMIIITASAAEWVRPWAVCNGFDDVLSSQLEVKDGKVTGKLVGKNCYGVEKVNAFIAKYGALENYYTIGFGDSAGDKEILEKVNQPYYRKYE